jgi:hypothetical protein
MGFDAIVPPYDRTVLHSREMTYNDTSSDVSVPVLVTHGEEGTIVLPATAEDHAGLIPDARIS